MFWPHCSMNRDQSVIFVDWSSCGQSNLTLMGLENVFWNTPTKVWIVIFFFSFWVSTCGVADDCIIVKKIKTESPSINIQVLQVFEMHTVKHRSWFIFTVLSAVKGLFTQLHQLDVKEAFNFYSATIFTREVKVLIYPDVLHFLALQTSVHSLLISAMHWQTCFGFLSSISDLNKTIYSVFVFNFMFSRHFYSTVDIYYHIVP